MEATKELQCYGGPMDGDTVPADALNKQGSLIRNIANSMQTTTVGILNGLAIAKALVWGFGDGDVFGRNVEYALQGDKLKFMGYLS